MLRSKIAQIHDQQPLLLEPSSRIEEISEQWTDQVHTSAGFSFEVDNPHRPMSPLYRSRNFQKDIEDTDVAHMRGDDDLGLFDGSQRQRVLEGRRTSWPLTIGEELTTTLTNSSDLYEQLQNFDGSFDAFQSFDNLDPFLYDNDIMQRLAGDGLSNFLSPNAVFS